jgi:hypothetical protein
MSRNLIRITLATVALALSAAPARAQLYGGYGPWYGYGGWGGYGWGGSTVQGDIAGGLGEFALGAGIFNELTAEAGAIDADTLMRLNQFVFLAQQEANLRNLQRRRAIRDAIVRAGERTYRRLRDDPDAHDIATGDALNAALDDLSNPRVSLNVLKRARVRLGGRVLRDIPLVCPRENPASRATASDLLPTTGGRPDATLVTLLNVMTENHLRFGVARTPGQRLVCEQLYEQLDALRDEAKPMTAVANRVRR